MTFNVGETVVYPNHGAAVIEDIETRTIKGEEKLYLVLRILGQNDLVVRVPASNLDLVGVRDVVDDEGLENVFEVLRKTNVEEPSNWSRRYKANLEKLHSGNVLKVAEVVRDLWRRERDRGLSAGEKRMLSKARQILVSELALAKKVADDRAEEMLDEVLASLFILIAKTGIHHTSGESPFLMPCRLSRNRHDFNAFAISSANCPSSTPVRNATPRNILTFSVGCFTAVVETIASGLNLSATRGTSATRQCSIRALIPRSRSNR